MKRLTDEEEIERLNGIWNTNREACLAKTALLNQGYGYTMSLYGVVRDKTEGLAGYRRIEIYSDVAFGAQLIEYVYRFIQSFPPNKRYSIYVYDSKINGIRLVRQYR